MSKRLTNALIMLVSIALLSSLTMVFTNPEALAQRARNDERNDLIKGCTGQPVSQVLTNKAGFIDIVQASASVDSEANYLTLRLKTAEPIPTQAKNLVSYSFLVDLDGSKETGFTGNRSPMGVFSGLGIDLWVNYSYYQNGRDVFGFLGSQNISNLKSRSNLVNHRIKDNRQTPEFTVSIGQIETVLSFAYLHIDPNWEIKPDEMKWVAFTNWAPSSREDPVSDVFPGNYYSQSSPGCLTNPLVEIITEGEEPEGEEPGGGGNGEPPPPPPPPSPPS